MLRELRDDLWVLRRGSRSERRTRARLVASTLDLQPMRGARGDVWAVAVVRDEADIIASTIRHLLDQGVDRVVVADNGSTDATPDILRDLGEPVTTLEDRCEGHYQEEKVTRLLRAAARNGARWVVPFDADELWCATGGTLADFFASGPACIVRAEVYNYVPRALDDWTEPDPVKRIVHRQPTPALDPKFALRAHRLGVVAAGNIDVVRPGCHQIGEGLIVRHYPYRSEAQFLRKVAAGRAALAATDLEASVGEHWRRLGALSSDELSSMWRALLEDGTPLPFDSWGVGGPLTRAPL